VIEFRVGNDAAGSRLDVVLARHAGVSRAVAGRAIDRGDVTIEGVVAKRAARVEAGVLVRATLRDEAAERTPGAEEIDVRAVYEDEALLVVSKPAGLVVHPAPGHATGTLVNALIARGARGGPPQRPGIVHRLDAGTSGLMIVAKDPIAFERLAAAMSARDISRIYLALVEGSPDADAFTVDAPIGRSPRNRKKMAVVEGGREARTELHVLERHARTALVEARPYTGRTHQIRVHLRAAGHPVVGDPVYGRARTASTLGLKRPFLHAVRLRFEHPMTGALLDLEDPLPPDLSDALARARAL
jgi:23S rRNA pseudouridine1911/1915/1917 synthase